MSADVIRGMLLLVIFAVTEKWWGDQLNSGGPLELEVHFNQRVVPTFENHRVLRGTDYSTIRPFVLRMECEP